MDQIITVLDKRTKRAYYPNGAIEMIENDNRQYIIYDTNDIVLFDANGNVRRVITHDGVKIGDK